METRDGVVGALLDFARYCRQCTDPQVIALHRKESGAGRDTYAMVAYLECMARDLNARH